MTPTQGIDTELNINQEEIEEAQKKMNHLRDKLKDLYDHREILKQQFNEQVKIKFA